MVFSLVLQDKNNTEIDSYCQKDPGYNYLKAAYNGDLDFLKNSNYDELASFIDEEGRNALHYAALGGKFAVIKYLIMDRKMDINSQDGEGSNTIDFAEASEVEHVKEHIESLIKEMTKNCGKAGESYPGQAPSFAEQLNLQRQQNASQGMSSKL